MLFERLTDSIKAAIGRAWDAWFTSLHRRAAEFEDSELPKSEVFRRGAREGYWQGASDMLGIVCDAEWMARELRRKHKQPLPSPWADLMEETH